MPTLILVRHGERLRTPWTPDDQQPLSKKGRASVKRLATRLADSGLTDVRVRTMLLGAVAIFSAARPIALSSRAGAGERGVQSEISGPEIAQPATAARSLRTMTREDRVPTPAAGTAADAPAR